MVRRQLELGTAKVEMVPHKVFIKFDIGARWILSQPGLHDGDQYFRNKVRIVPGTGDTRDNFLHEYSGYSLSEVDLSIPDSVYCDLDLERPTRRTKIFLETINATLELISNDY